MPLWKRSEDIQSGQIEDSSSSSSYAQLSVFYQSLTVVISLKKHAAKIFIVIGLIIARSYLVLLLVRLVTQIIQFAE